jgi:uncharacterized RDD family membrane protein YckC
MPCPNHPQIFEPLVRCERCSISYCLDCVVPIAGFPHCAACKAEVLADLAAGVTLGHLGGLDLASIGSRFAALFVDGLLIGLPAVALAFAIAIPLGFFSLEKTMAEGAIGLFFQLLYTFLYLGGWILYEGLMLSRNGQTLGKKALRIKVVSADGGDLTRGQAFGRTAGRQLLGLIPCFSLVDYAMAFGQERTCIHDMLAKTRVVNFHA